MDYPFHPWEYKVYHKTFLKDVHLVIGYASEDSVDTIYEKIFVFCDEQYHVSYNENEREVAKKNGAQIVSADKMTKFVFKSNQVSLHLKTPAYNQIKVALVMMKYIYGYQNTLNRPKVDGLKFYKFNELAYETTDNSSLLEIMGSVFSTELMNLIDEKDKAEQGSLARWEKIQKKNAINENGDNFVIEFGYQKSSTELNKGAITLKTQIENTSLSLEVDKLEEKILKFNQILDEGFHWCINPSIIKVMEAE